MRSPTSAGMLLVMGLMMAGMLGADESKSRLPEEPIPLRQLPSRPKPLLELGAPFLGTGTLSGGFTVPTGATWQPSLLVWGAYQSAVFAIEDRHDTATSEWSHRLDLSTQLSLSYTERVVLSLRPLDEDGEFTRHLFAPGDARGGDIHFDSTVDTLFFEGDVGELFPNLDPDDSRSLDVGFAVGRQPLILQDGMFIADSIDSVGVVRNAIPLRGVSNFRVTGFFGWGHLNRGGNRRLDPAARIFGVFTEADLPTTTVAADFAYVSSDLRAGDGVFAAVSAAQRVGGFWSTTFRGLTSYALTEETEWTGRGTLLLAETSLTPKRTHDVAYFNVFAALGRYTPPARAARLGGPLGRVGIAFEGAGVGAYGAVLDSDAAHVWGFAAGYQYFFHRVRGHLVLELAARDATDALGLDQGALGARFEHALGRRFVARVEGFWLGTETRKPRYGARTALAIRF